MKIYVGNLLIKMYYPNVLSFLVKKVGFEQAKTRIFQIGQETGREMLKVWDPKTKDVKTLILKWYKLMWNKNKNVKITMAEENRKIIYHIIDKKCNVCEPELIIEGLQVPCVSMAGNFDACMEYLAKILPIQSFQVQTVKSLATGDPYCEHQIELVRG